ncbi:peptidase inhibitor family I36 protein [Streptomyces sp. NPDC048211]|uniref:peptidase inhibitor family I36 protein n=1 Tax=Streptomyces sp. NPDC048211 TaxID=3365516 RepID=UPI003713DEFE
MGKFRVFLCLAAAIGGVALASPAQAASYDGTCNSSGGGEICLYRDANVKGVLYDTLYSKPSYTGTYFGTSVSINDSVTSAKNMDPDTNAYVFTNPNYTGVNRVLWTGTIYNDFESDLDNKISSHCFANNASCPIHI